MTAYQDKNREYQDSVLAMTRDDLANAIAFYKSFFETENTPMEDKGSILIHETAHLAAPPSPA
ncbi:MAG: hypothetical protein R3Y46_02645 [Opitutales bacterium]